MQHISSLQVSVQSINVQHRQVQTLYSKLKKTICYWMPMFLSSFEFRPGLIKHDLQQLYVLIKYCELAAEVRKCFIRQLTLRLQIKDTLFIHINSPEDAVRVTPCSELLELWHWQCFSFKPFHLSKQLIYLASLIIPLLIKDWMDFQNTTFYSYPRNQW